ADLHVDGAGVGEANSDSPSAELFPVATSERHLAVYDPKTRQVTLIGTCFSTHHLQFAEDANHTLWTSSGGGGGVVGWLNTKMFEETHDELPEHLFTSKAAKGRRARSCTSSFALTRSPGEPHMKTLRRKSLGLSPSQVNEVFERLPLRGSSLLRQPVLAGSARLL
ncbi:MAG: hypothetical protein DMG26_10265, partial [Acidobacteria bacterium]